MPPMAMSQYWFGASEFGTETAQNELRRKAWQVQLFAHQL